jgi:hypothetical protein
MKVMPLLLTVITPFVMVSGMTQAQERFLLAQIKMPQQQYHRLQYNHRQYSQQRYRQKHYHEQC